MVGVYKISSPSGSIYIGQTRNTTKRFVNYKSCNRRQIHIYNSIQKYGYSAHTFEVVHELPEDIEQTILDNYEVLYWNQYKESGFKMMNIREPGKTGGHTDESKRKISEARKGMKFSDEHRRKISLSQTGGHRNLGMRKSEEFRMKLSLRSKGNQYAKKSKNGKQ